MLVIAHISDLHFNGSRRARSRVKAVMDYINDRADGIDVLLVTGDIADTGTTSQYMEAAGVLKSPLPMLLCPGNHDRRAEFAHQLLGRDSGDKPINTALRVNGALVLSMDSSVPDEPQGLLSYGTLDWADQQITDFGDGGPVLMAFHHPPVTLEMPFMDAIRMQGTPRLGALIDKHPSVVGMFCGHAHTGAITQFHNRRVALAPGVASTLNLPFEGGGIINETQPPGLAFHVIDDDWRIITHYRAVTVKSRRWSNERGWVER
ncbi:metallophosphoesterase [Gordonia jinhuaensis]|uniref:3',5'-cyclic adenosine monophosphate phosphodiesterase CpdA n=1 Tax=Gordonia jinhuaensis TaxID=1517702 RepID=A0A916TGV2_9ACTN|nr:metallophosphoesterase [Gordonia jinhuaensis]GGB44907.1 3',5'-cyclic adenosine monophosphate phosphodiesterase CpdA [Gordonia jinhuaensis]